MNENLKPMKKLGENLLSFFLILMGHINLCSNPAPPRFHTCLTERIVWASAIDVVSEVESATRFCTEPSLHLISTSAVDITPLKKSSLSGPET